MGEKFLHHRLEVSQYTIYFKITPIDSWGRRGRDMYNHQCNQCLS